jgi:threonine dehydrogenase-like Zn-dependent dehydrogenase
MTGADVVVDPSERSPYEVWLEATGTPPPPSPLLTPAHAPAHAVVFDCVGAPGLLQQEIEAVPAHSRLVVVGVCAQPDTFVPVNAIEKELSIRFVFAYRPEEFAGALDLIARGRAPVGEWVTAVRPLEEVQSAFADLSTPEHHCKILLTP